MVAGQHLQQLTDGGKVTVFDQIHVRVIIRDCARTSSGSRRHSDEKSGSTVLLRVHFIGVDSELGALFEKQKNRQSSVREQFPTFPFFPKKLIFH